MGASSSINIPLNNFRIPFTLQDVEAMPEFELKRNIQQVVFSWNNEVLRASLGRASKETAMVQQLAGYARIKECFLSHLLNRSSETMIQMLVKTVNRHSQGNSIIKIVRFISGLRTDNTETMTRKLRWIGREHARIECTESLLYEFGDLLFQSIVECAGIFLSRESEKAWIKVLKYIIAAMTRHQFIFQRSVDGVVGDSRNKYLLVEEHQKQHTKPLPQQPQMQQPQTQPPTPQPQELLQQQHHHHHHYHHHHHHHDQQQQQQAVNANANANAKDCGSMSEPTENRMQQQPLSQKHSQKHQHHHHQQHNNHHHPHGPHHHPHLHRQHAWAADDEDAEVAGLTDGCGGSGGMVGTARTDCDEIVPFTVKPFEQQ